MRFRASLRDRFIGAVLCLIVLTCGGFYYAVYQFVEVLESQLMDTAVKRELHEMVDIYRSTGAAPVHHSNGMRGYAVIGEGPAAADFPPELSSWASGRYDEIEIDGREFYAGRENVGDAALFAVLDLAEIEALEERLIKIAYAVILSALLAAVVVGYALSLLVMKPVARLALHVSELKAGVIGERLADRFGDRDIGLIADAVDRYQGRIELFARRERAFTDDASHELRTPLSVVLSALPLLKDENALSAQGRERLARVERAARQMHAMIEAMLFLAREDGGWRAEPCALEEILIDCADAYRQIALDKNLRLGCMIVQPLTVLAPQGIAASVIANLLSNAIQHTQQGSVNLRLEADRLVVEDTGSGISMPDQSRIFERGYKGVRSQGLGIGLNLVQRICERLGWTINVHAEPGTGTRFEVVFPPTE